jgi:hypothetical protein
MILKKPQPIDVVVGRGGRGVKITMGILAKLLRLSTINRGREYRGRIKQALDAVWLKTGVHPLPISPG